MTQSHFPSELGGFDDSYGILYKREADMKQHILNLLQDNDIDIDDIHQLLTKRASMRRRLIKKDSWDRIAKKSNWTRIAKKSNWTRIAKKSNWTRIAKKGIQRYGKRGSFPKLLEELRQNIG